MNGISSHDVDNTISSIKQQQEQNFNEVVINVKPESPTYSNKMLNEPRVPFKSWYMSNYCNEKHLSYIIRVQQCLPSLTPLLIIYFKIWSLAGEAEFYTTLIPLMSWLNMPDLALHTCILMSLSQYLTGIFKDMAGCPRPPCPPVELRGRACTSKEYGYISTHSSHCVVFAYAVYEFLVSLFPLHPFMCWLVCVFFIFNVSLSRLFLGMHWPADVVSGWIAASAIITFHSAFLKSWLDSIFKIKEIMIWHYVLAYLIVHILSILHAAPVDKCPCYLDSLRFLGASLGALFGYWTFRAQYGDTNTNLQSSSENMLGLLFSWDFLWKYMCCLIIVVLGKEISSFLSIRILRWYFTLVSRKIALNCPQPFRGAWTLYSHCIRCAYLIPYHDYSSNEELCQENQEQQQYHHHHKFPNNKLNGSSINGVGNTIKSLDITSEKRKLEDISFLRDSNTNNTSLQIWSPRTHRHWWLWEAQKYTVSYFVVGILVLYVCPVILHLCSSSK